MAEFLLLKKRAKILRILCEKRAKILRIFLIKIVLRYYRRKVRELFGGT